jgi:NADH-quinone oxidoreductase subunit H
MGDPFGLVGQWLFAVLTGWGLEAGPATTIQKLIGAAVMATFAMVFMLFTIWVERKLIARIQDRLGPNRVGPFGVFQTVADLLKLLTKEVLIPSGADKIVFLLAPLLAVMSVIGIWGVVPMSPTLLGADINVGVLYVISIGSVGTLGIMMAGLSSNNKYAMLGAFRTVAQMLSYAVPMVLALLIPTLLAGSMGLNEIVLQQKSVPFILLAPIAALVFFISSVAEVGRAPFDLLEAESEIVAGFHIEYSGLAFGMFFVGEFLHAFTISALTATLFLGGWSGPGAEAIPILGFVYFSVKTALVYFVVIWMRGTFPRIRIDQMNAFNWKIMTPVSLAILIFAAIADKLASQLELNRLAVHLGGNVVLVLVFLWVLRAYARGSRLRDEAAAAQGTEISTVSGTGS